MALYARVLVICLKSNLPRLLRVRSQNRDAPVRYPYRIATLTRYIAVAFITICFLVTGTAQAGAAREVLILNSYHPTYEWTKLVMEGIESTLQQYEDRIELDIEYMDARHLGLDDERHYENLCALYKHKSSRRQYDIIIVADNEALHFLLQYREELYPDVPIVFCGVEKFDDSMLQGHDDVTGVLEEKLWESAVEIALKLHSSVKQIVLVSNRASGMCAKLEQDLARVIQKFSGRVKFVNSFLYELSMAELLKIVGGLGNESVVVFTSMLKDPEGNIYAFEDGATMLREQCSVPIYIVAKEWLGLGPVIGGRVVSASQQGQTAAKMAMRILDGEEVRDIPIVRDSPSQYIFDYVQMKRFGISLSDLPEGSIVINEPESFYYLYKRRIWTMITIVAGLATVVMILSANILRRKQAEEKLKQYQFMVESAHDAIFFKDLRSRYIIANNKTLEAFGLSREQIIGKNDYEIMPDKEEANRNIEDDQVVFHTGKLKEITKHMTGADGKEHWFQAIKVPQFDGKGNAVGLIGIARDVTERKRAEEALQLERDNLMNILDSMEDGVYIVDQNHDIQYVNPILKKDFGPFEERKCYEYFHDRDKVCPWCKNKEVFAGKKVRWEWYSFKNHRTYDLIDTPLRNPDGSISKLEIFRDITEHKRAEEALRESEGKLGAMLESIGDHMSMLDKDLNIIWANKTAQKIFGNNIIGKKCYEVYHKRREPCEPHPCPALKAFQDGKIHEHDTQVIDKNGERIYFHCSTNVALRDKEGNPTAVIEICKDITERKQAAEALRERTLELGKRVKEQNCLYDMAEILDTPEILLDDILQKTAAIIPPAFQYPEITSVRVILKGQEFRTENFRETSWKQSSDIIVSGEQIGSVEVCYLEKKPQMDKGPFLKEEISLLDAIAERLRRVIERREAEEKVLHYQAQLKSLASELSLTEERERHRIATELHDRISQSIVISKVKLEELRESTSSADLAKSIGEICNWLDETIQNTRLLTSDLSSPILYELGFEAAVSEWLAEQIQKKHGIATEFEDDGQPKPLDDDIRALLFHMVQELLINVVKHAQAHKVKVFSRKVNSEVHVSVEDDGVGFNPTETASMPTKTGGFGLFSIRERLEQLGGRLEIKSEPGHGCRITVMAPLKQEKINDEGQE